MLQHQPNLSAPPQAFIAIALPSQAERRIAALRPSEQEVARGLISGRSNAEIAAQRGTSQRTIANQVAAIFRTYGVSSRAGLARSLERASLV